MTTIALSLTDAQIPMEEREVGFAPILTASYDAILLMSQRSTSELDLSEKSIFLINNIFALHAAISSYDFVKDWVSSCCVLAQPTCEFYSIKSLYVFYL